MIARTQSSIVIVAAGEKEKEAEEVIGRYKAKYIPPKVININQLVGITMMVILFNEKPIERR